VFNFFRKSKSWKQLFEEARAHGSAGKFKQAENCFRRAVRAAPSEPYPHYELGYTLALVGKHREALSEFEITDCLSRDFFSVQTDAYLSRQLLSGTLNKEALDKLRALQRLTDLGGDVGDEALAAGREIVAMVPKCALGHFYLGKTLLRMRQPGAEQALQECLQLGPDDTTAIDAKFHLGILKRDQGEEETARNIWSGILADYPGNVHTKFAEMMLGKGSA
jgi:tetratricopeptide (TPR) repeat protein